MRLAYNAGASSNNLVLALDSMNPKSYGGAGFAHNIITGWVDYGGNSSHYTVDGSSINDHTVTLKSTSTGWVGYMNANPDSTGYWTVEFTYYTLSGTSSLVLDNDGIMNNSYNNTYSVSTTPVRARVQINNTTTGNIKFFFRQNGSNDIKVEKVNYYRSDKWYNIAPDTYGSYTATLYSGVSYNGKSLEFNGSSQYGAVASPLTDHRYNWTIEVLVKCDNASSNPMVITPSNAGIDHYIRILNNTFRAQFCRIADNQGRSTETSITNGEFYVLTVVRTPRQVRLYVDGKLATTETDYEISAEWAGTWRIGQRGNSTYWFDGFIQSIKAWKRPLDDNEVQMSAASLRNRTYS